MRTLYKINGIAILVTIGLYLTFWGGILAQIVLGGIQIVSAIYILFNFKRLEQGTKKLMLTYVLGTLLLLGICLIINDPVMILWGVSGLLALYFLFVTYRIKKTLV